MTDDDLDAKLARLTRLSEAFTPSAPVRRRDLFAGRINEIMSVASALSEPGRQVVLYGERGVGKTSLANIISQFRYQGDHHGDVTTVRVNCQTNDTFGSIWKRVFLEAQRQVPDSWTYGAPEPDEVRRLLGSGPTMVVILDEFDRVDDDDSLSLMADLLKAVSDHAITTKIIVVGVASSIDQLIGEHESVQRAIEEVLMPRMSQEDMEGIISAGAAHAGVTFSAEAITYITRLAEGLPHYVHLLALAAGRRCIQNDEELVSVVDVEMASQDVIRSHSLLREYQTAVQSSRSESLFAHVLAACALAEKNKLGQFTSGAVRAPLSQIMGRPYAIPAFAPHLKAFTEGDRGCVLVQEGVPRRYTYRFRNPLLQPFAVLAALTSGIVPEAMVGDPSSRDTLDE